MDIKSLIKMLQECETAMERQEGKRPEMVYIGKTTTPVYACPNCNSLPEQHQQYCSDCGQHIFWGMPDFLD